MSIWKYLLAGGVGFGVAKLIGGNKKTQSETSSKSSNNLPTTNPIAPAIKYGSIILFFVKQTYKKKH